ncbi:TetR/AcrR family transcriptional regulator [Streptomyces sp. NPDC048639]|uniref:TetR/AcrR family transcriptional regulator n=1 Tax=Streptomyces sp. NPDC048639 TaxID=3365581 RepID=UPI0037192061
MPDTARTGPERLTPGARRILDAASKLFYGRGIHAVGVDTIAAEAGVTKKTLYDRFGSKDALVVAYLEARDRRWRERLTDRVDTVPEGAPGDRLLATFDALGEWMRTENPRGCGFANAAAELPDAGHPARRVIAAQKEWMLGYLTELAAAAGVLDPSPLAERLMILHEGATVLHALGTVRHPTDQARTVAAGLLAEARD